MGKRKTPKDLGGRERQLVETVHRLGEAAVADVRSNLADPPSYSSVRAMLGLLVEKGYLKVRQDGKRYLYRPAESQKKAQKSAIDRVVSTFFAGSTADAVAALLDASSKSLSDEELDRIQSLIHDAEKKNKSKK